MKTQCLGSGCPLKNNCLRYNPYPNLSYTSFIRPPYEFGKCWYYLPKEVTLEQMTEMFDDIGKKKNDIKVLEEKIKPVFQEILIKFFEEKGFTFLTPKREYPSFVYKYTLNPEYLKRYDEFNHPIFEIYPEFRVKTWTFMVRFIWKKKNQNTRHLYWHPDEISLNEFYEKKLKKIFDLI